MKHLLIAASAVAILATPAQAQLLRGATAPLNGTLNSTLRMPVETVRSTTTNSVRGNAATQGEQNVNRETGEVSLTRSVDGSFDGSTSQLIETPFGSAAGDAAGSGSASGSGNANAQLIGTDAVRGAAQDSTSRVRDGVMQAREFATPVAGEARDRTAGMVGQAGSLAGSANGAASGAGMIDGGMLALAGSGAAQGDGAFAVEPGMPVQLPSGEQLGTVREVVATRSGEVRQLVVETKDGLSTIPAANLMASGSALVAGEASGSASNEAPADPSDGE